MLPNPVVKIWGFLFVVFVASGCVLFDEVEYSSDSEVEHNSDSDSSEIQNYWETGFCPGNTATMASVVSDNCSTIDFYGCCDANGNALYCYNGKLYCQSCASNVAGQGRTACSWDAAETVYWCTAEDNGVDPSGTHLSTCPAF